jgi:DNA-binding transcriptional ArsR family regulator
MRPLIHPSIEDITLEGLLHALSDPVRAAIYAELAVAEGANCSSFLQVCDRPIPKSTLSQHFRALREAGLIRSERSGVEMHNTTRCKEIEQRFPGLIPSIMKAYSTEASEKARGAKRKAAAKKARGA